jgi:hypothetical protein
MISRRGALELGALGLCGLAGCQTQRAATLPPAQTTARWRLDPLVDLVAAAGLAWVVVLAPRALFARPAIARAIADALPDAQLDVWPTKLGGVDVRLAGALVLAEFPGTTLVLARLPVDPSEIERAFASRVLVEGRAREHGVSRLFGSFGTERAQVAVFGRQAVALEVGHLGPLRASIYFAEGRLKRSLPALQLPPLSALAARFGDSPIQGLAPGPFEGTWAQGAAGLLAGATAAGVSLSPTEGPRGDALRARLVLAGGWGVDAPAAARRLEASFRVLADDPLGRLCALDRPLLDPVARAEPDFVELDVLLDPMALAHGIHAATAASISEIIAP